MEPLSLDLSLPLFVLFELLRIAFEFVSLLYSGRDQDILRLGRDEPTSVFCLSPVVNYQEGHDSLRIRMPARFERSQRYPKPRLHFLLFVTTLLFNTPT